MHEQDVSLDVGKSQERERRTPPPAHPHPHPPLINISHPGVGLSQPVWQQSSELDTLVPS